MATESKKCQSSRRNRKTGGMIQSESESLRPRETHGMTRTLRAESGSKAEKRGRFFLPLSPVLFRPPSGLGDAYLYQREQVN